MALTPSRRSPSSLARRGSRRRDRIFRSPVNLASPPTRRCSSAEERLSAGCRAWVTRQRRLRAVSMSHLTPSDGVPEKSASTGNTKNAIKQLHSLRCESLYCPVFPDVAEGLTWLFGLERLPPAAKDGHSMSFANVKGSSMQHKTMPE